MIIMILEIKYDIGRFDARCKFYIAGCFYTIKFYLWQIKISHLKVEIIVFHQCSALDWNVIAAQKIFVKHIFWLNIINSCHCDPILCSYTFY